MPSSNIGVHLVTLLRSRDPPFSLAVEVSI